MACTVQLIAVTLPLPKANLLSVIIKLVGSAKHPNVILKRGFIFIYTYNPVEKNIDNKGKREIAGKVIMLPWLLREEKAHRKF